MNNEQNTPAAEPIQPIVFDFDEEPGTPIAKTSASAIMERLAEDEANQTPERIATTNEVLSKYGYDPIPATALQEQVALADEMLAEVIAEEQQAEAASQPAQPTRLPDAIAADVLSKSVLINVRLSKLGNARKIPKDKVDVGDADKAMISASQKLIDSPKLTAIGKLDSETRSYLYDNCLQVSWLAAGTYMLPFKLIERVESFIAAQKQKRIELIEEFIQDYAAAVESARERLGNIFDPSNYLTANEARRTFTFEHNYIQLSTPDLSGLSKELYEQEKAKMSAQWGQAAAEVQQVLRDAANDLLGHLLDKLQPADGDKKVIFKDTTVTNLLDFLENFKDRNLTQDGQLEEIVQQASELLKGVTPQDLRGKKGNEATRDNVRNGLAELKTKLDAISTVDAPVRQFSFEEGE